MLFGHGCFKWLDGIPESHAAAAGGCISPRASLRVQFRRQPRCRVAGAKFALLITYLLFAF